MILAQKTSFRRSSGPSLPDGWPVDGLPGSNPPSKAAPRLAGYTARPNVAKVEGYWMRRRPHVKRAIAELRAARQAERDREIERAEDKRRADWPPSRCRLPGLGHHRGRDDMAPFQCKRSVLPCPDDGQQRELAAKILRRFAPDKKPVFADHSGPSLPDGCPLMAFQVLTHQARQHRDWRDIPPGRMSPRSRATGCAGVRTSSGRLPNYGPHVKLSAIGRSSGPKTSAEPNWPPSRCRLPGLGHHRGRR